VVNMDDVLKEFIHQADNFRSWFTEFIEKKNTYLEMLHRCVVATIWLDKQTNEAQSDCVIFTPKHGLGDPLKRRPNAHIEQ